MLGAAWLFDSDKVATCAHLVVLYADCLPALKVRFPAAGMEREVVAISFHPKFNMKTGEQMAYKALSSTVPALSLQEHNLAILTLGGGPIDLSADIAASLNERLSSPPPPRDKGIGGSLSEIDLPMVIQTITNARKEGTLIISDERNRSLARLFCKDGKILHAAYGPLANEKAIYQIVSQRLVGNFYFNSRKDPDWPVQSAIARPTDMLLIEAHRRLDEIPKVLLELGGDTTIYERTAPNLNVEVLSPDVRNDAQAVWPYLDGGVPIGQLWRVVDLDDYAVFLCLSELLKTNHIKELQFYCAVSIDHIQPLRMAPELPLAPFDDIQNMTVDSMAGQPQVTSGHLLGSLRPGDPWHLLHNLSLSSEASGSPIFKDGQVIGIHCGKLPASPSVTTGASTLNQLLWVESVYECLGVNRNGSEASSHMTTRILPAGCTEVARIDCPRCGSSSLDSAKFCKSCGQALIQDFEDSKPRFSINKQQILSVAATLITLVVIRLGYWAASNWHPPEVVPVAKPASEVRVTPSVLKADPKIAKFIPVPSGTVFHNGDLIALQMKLSRDSYLYVLHQGTNPTDINLLFPDSASADIKYQQGSTISIPRETTMKVPGGTVALSGLTVTGAPGTEYLVYLVADTPSNVFTAPATVSKVYETASKALGKTVSPQGVEMSTGAFGEDVFPGSTKPDNKQQVYLTRIQLTHTE